MSGLEYRAYRAGDERAILDLFTACYAGRVMTEQYWQWRFRDNPSGEIAIELAWEREKLVGHYAVSPTLVTVFQQDAMTGLSMTTMTHPDYRGRALFPALARRLYGRLSQHDYFLIWGFPNAASHRGFIRDLGWRDIREIPMLTLELGELPRLPDMSANICVLPAFDNRFDALWREAAPSYPIVVKRDSTYLSWRFDKNPVIDYQILAYFEADQLLGYAVINIYQRDQAQIVDLLTVPDSAIAQSIVTGVLHLSLDQGAKIVKMWLPAQTPLHLYLERLGFENRLPVTYFGARVLNPLPGRHDVTDLGEWHYLLSDSDNF